MMLQTVYLEYQTKYHASYASRGFYQRNSPDRQLQPDVFRCRNHKKEFKGLDIDVCIKASH